MKSEDGISLNQIDTSQLELKLEPNYGSVGLVDQLEKSLNLEEKVITIKKKRTPKRVLYFSDGTLEEYSTDEEEEAEKRSLLLQQSQKMLIDPRELSWGGWLGYHAGNTGSSVLAACDYMGENIAYYLGITSPKYQYEIEEAQRALKEEEEERRKAAEAMEGWSSSPEGVNSITTDSTLGSSATPSLSQTFLLNELQDEGSEQLAALQDCAAAAATEASAAEREPPAAGVAGAGVDTHRY